MHGSLSCHWQYNLVWLNYNSLKHAANSWHCFGVSREVFFCLLSFVWTRHWGTQCAECCLDTLLHTSCSAEFSLPDFESLKKLYVLPWCLEVNKFESHWASTVPLYNKRWFLLQGIYIPRCFTAGSLTLLSYCLTLTLQYFLIEL